MNLNMQRRPFSYSSPLMAGQSNQLFCLQCPSSSSSLCYPPSVGVMTEVCDFVAVPDRAGKSRKEIKPLVVDAYALVRQIKKSVTEGKSTSAQCHSNAKKKTSGRCCCCCREGPAPDNQKACRHVGFGFCHSAVYSHC
jgi:hypothetical protein